VATVPPDWRDADRGGRWFREPLPEGSLLPFAPSRTETGAQGSQDKHGNDECLRLPSELTSRKTIAGVHALPAGTALRVPNTGARHRAALALDRGGTGRAHRLRADQPLPSGAGVLLAAAGLPLAPVNPRLARRFAQAPGLQARTDKTCARMLAEMGAAPDPRPAGPQPCKPAPSQGPGRRPQGAGGRPRGGWQSHRGAQPGLAAASRTPPSRRHRGRYRADRGGNRRPDRRRSRAWPDKARLLQSLPGVAASCRSDTPRRSPGAWPARARQIAALAGLAPVTRESGTWRGKATLQGGRRPLRRALTMPTLTAIRRNRDLAALFTRLRAAGKHREARPCRGNAQTPHPRQHTPARRTGMAGNKASTKPLTNTDTGRGLWPPAGQGAAWRCAGVMAPALEAGAVPSRLRAGTGNATHVSPPLRDGAL